jgi:predicted Zn-dependent peptidase
MTFEFSFRAGNFLTERKKWETPHIMEHLSLGANSKYKKSRIFEAEFKKNGSYSNAHTSVYNVWYDAECADFEWERILDLLTLAFSEPYFSKAEFDAECGNVRDELIGRANNHGRTLSIAMYESFGMLAMPDKEAVKLMTNVTLDDIKNHHKKTHTTSNMRFVIAGNLKGRMKHIEEVLSKIKLPKGRGRIDLPNEAPEGFKKSIYIPRSSVGNVYFDLTTFTNRKFNDDDWAAASIANNILTETLYSKILGEARERGLIYNMGSGFGQYKNYVDWGIGGQAQQENLPALFDIIVRELKKIKTGDVSDEDIEAAKQYALGSYQRSAQTVGGTMAGYSYRYFHDGQINDYFGYPERLKKVKKAKVVEIMQAMFADNIWGLGILGTASEELRALAEQKASELWQK